MVTRLMKTLAALVALACLLLLAGVRALFALKGQRLTLQLKSILALCLTIRRGHSFDNYAVLVTIRPGQLLLHQSPVIGALGVHHNDLG